MTAEEWQAHVTRQAAEAIGGWLEARGRLEHPIHRLTMPELEAMASSAISRFIVLGSERIRDGLAEPDLIQRLLGPLPAPCAAAPPVASASAGEVTGRSTASAPTAACAADNTSSRQVTA